MELAKNNFYIVGVSGGPDSVFLVHWLWRHGYRNLVLAHVNYHWRKDSDQDQKIVELLAQKLKLPVVVKNISSHQQKPKAINFEAWARDQRYDYFASLQQKYPQAIVVVGHQENDLIESYLMQKQRLGIVSYYGLKDLTEHHQAIIWRPLLKYKKSEILKWLKTHKIDYILDITNEDLTLKRNQIRSQLKESDFEKIKQKIVIDNENNHRKNEKVLNYLTKNQQREKLLLNAELKNWDLEMIERLIFYFFEKQNFSNPLLDRKRSVLKEISQRLLNSKKNFWSLELDTNILIKDYDFLHLLKIENLPQLELTLNSSNDFYKLEKFKNKDQIIAIIREHGGQFPYTIYRLDSPKIKGAKWQQKSLIKTLANKKINYKNRLKTGVIYNLKQDKFLDYWDW